MNQNQVNRNRNPLLSMAVTGGFDEFTGSGIVLAAAGKSNVSLSPKNFSISKFYLFCVFLRFCTQSFFFIGKFLLRFQRGTKKLFHDN